MAQIEFQSNPRLRSNAILKIAGLLLALTACHKTAQPSLESTISFTQVPQWDLGDLNQEDVIEGTVSGSRPGQNMVVYSKTGGLWWLQPRVKFAFHPNFARRGLAKRSAPRHRLCRFTGGFELPSSGSADRVAKGRARDRDGRGQPWAGTILVVFCKFQRIPVAGSKGTQRSRRDEEPLRSEQRLRRSIRSAPSPGCQPQ